MLWWGGHATGFRAAEFGEYGADAYIVYFRGIEVGEFGDGSFEDLRGVKWLSRVVGEWGGILLREVHAHRHRVVHPSSLL
jgi:hypothetical protein